MELEEFLWQRIHKQQKQNNLRRWFLHGLRKVIKEARRDQEADWIELEIHPREELVSKEFI
jgi:ribosomal protein L19E